MENLGTSLWITLIGMGLVFIAIILLWGLMALLVNITKDKEEPETITGESSTVINNGEQKARAAAAAVAVALATNTASPYQGKDQPPTAQVSAWQSAKRNPAQ